MKTNKWISIKSVIPFIFDSIDESLVDEGILYDWCYSAWDRMEIYQFTIPKTSFLNIENYKAKLPCDLQTLEMVMYNTDLTTAVADMQSCAKDYGDLNWYINNNYLSLYRNFYNRGWQVIKKPTGKFQMTFKECDGELYNFTQSCASNCGHNYNVLQGVGTGYLQTTFKEGIVVIAYRGKLTDGDDYLIPDDTLIKETIKAYCMMRLWESRYNAKEEGADQRFNRYSLEWTQKKAIAKGKYKMPDSEELEQIRIQQTKMIQTTGQFDSHFANLASPELANLLNLQ